MVGDPPNIIIASRAGLSFNDFLLHLAPVVVVLVAVLIGLCRSLFADAFETDEERVAEIFALNERRPFGTIACWSSRWSCSGWCWPRSCCTQQVLWWALALGADLGGNATLVGASANIVVAGIAARNGTAIGFWQFTRYGLVVAGVTVAVSSLYVWLRYFVVAG